MNERRRGAKCCDVVYATSEAFLVVPEKCRETLVIDYLLIAEVYKLFYVA